MIARALLTGAALLLAACGSDDSPPSRLGSPPAASAPALVPIARDAAGAPRMLLALGRDAAPPGVVPASPAAQARAHLVRHAAVLGASGGELAALEVARVTDTGRGGVVTTFRAVVGGIEVVGSDVSVLTRRDGSLALISGLPPPLARERAHFALSEAQAFARALAAELGRAVSPDDLVAGGAVAGGYATFRAPGVRLLDPCRIKRVMTAFAGALHPAYQVEVLRDDAGRARGTGYLIDAASGAILRRHSLESDAAFQYRVWADPAAGGRPHDGPLADVTPHPTGEPDGIDPAATAPALVSMEAFNQPHDPWLADDATTTAGNNVDAYADLGGADGFDTGDLRATTTGTREFDRAYDLGAEPAATSAQIQAAVTHLFYVDNWLHDWWYDSGFDEAAGNAQLDNLGRGGVAGDPLLAEAQDFSGVENANMMTPADGVSPRMQMFLFRGTPERDAALDSTIVAHEWGHYLHHRLQSCGTWMCAALSEGWADFVALHTLIAEGDDPDGTYGMGTYAARDMVADLGGDSAYFGIRRAPYSRDVDHNALSFRHIAADETLPDTHPLFVLSPDNNEPHNAGEIWALMLFEAYQALLDRSRDGDYSFAEAERRMSDYAVAGLALSPADSTYLETRDAILAAAAAADLLDAQAMAAGFARRGAGSCALSPPFDSTDFFGVSEDFDLAARLVIAGVSVDDSVASCDDDGWLDGQERGQVHVVIGNPGPVALSGAAVTVSSGSTGVSFPDGAGAVVPTVPPFETREVAVEVALAAREGIGEVSVAVESAALASCEGATGVEITSRVNLDEEAQASAIDDVEAVTTTWTPTGAEADQLWSREIAGGSNHVWHADDTGAPTDVQLVSPAVTVAATGSLVLSFRHRHDFEYDGTYWDGAVLEITDDGGTTWRDLAELGSVPYSGVITDLSGNPLMNRSAFGGQSAGYPAMQTVSIDLGTSLAGQTVQIRFRVGTDAAVGAAGWELDDIALANIEETPFARVDPDDGAGCPAAGPDAGVPDAGGNDGPDGGPGGGGNGDGDGDDDGGGCGCRAGDGSQPTSALLVLFAFYWGAGRRRSRTKKDSGRRAGPTA